MVQFQLLGHNDPIPSGYRLATTQDAARASNKADLFKVLPGWEIANLANGSVQGATYGGNVRGDIRNDVCQRLAIYDPPYDPNYGCNSSRPSSFQLFNINDYLPQGYRLATVQDVEANPQALRAAMPGWEIANLADGSVDGASYGCNIRYETRYDVAHKLATRGNPSGPSKFQLFNRNDYLPQGYRLATVQDVEANPQALRAAMPGWETANLADGSVDGASYGCNISYETRDDVSHKLATRGNPSGPLNFQLFNVRDQLPPSYRLATRYEVESHRRALFQAMPGWEIANLADGSVDGASYGGRTSTVRRNDVTHKLAVQGM